jgi:hypothetical protein
MSPDISMCDNAKCKDCKTCYRFMAKPMECYQAYIIWGKKAPKNKKGCTMYWGIGESCPTAGQFRTVDIAIRGKR